LLGGGGRKGRGKENGPSDLLRRAAGFKRWRVLNRTWGKGGTRKMLKSDVKGASGVLSPKPKQDPARKPLE